MLLFPLIFIGCGDVAPKGSDNLPSMDECFISKPTNPPFIKFNDSNIGVVDDFKFEEDIKFPTTPIPSVPDIIN